MKLMKSFAKKYLCSTIGIILLFAIFAVINLLIKKINYRVDFTEDRLYTLSKGTLNILKKIDTPVTLRFYCSRKENQMPVLLRGFATRIENLLREYVIKSNGKLTLETFDPQPDSDAEDSAKMDGISAQPLPNGQRFYLGLAVSCLDKTVSIPIFNPSEENTLEYNISRSIYEASNPKLPILGIISDLPVMGGGTTPYMKNQAPRPAWIFVQELQRTFQVKTIEKNVDEIPNNIDVLLVLHPQKLEKKLVFAIDQYLLKGGRIIIAVDPFCIAEQRTSLQAMFGQNTMPGSSSLPELFSAWGLDFSKDKVVIDLDKGARNLSSPDSEGLLSVLDFNEINNPSNSPIMAGVNHLNLIFAGAFSGELKDGLEKTVLLESSKRSEMKESFLAQAPASDIMKNFTSDDKAKPLIMKISGKFKSAFPEGAPKEEKKDAENKEKNNNEETAKPAIKESEKESTVILISDVDLFYDQFCVSRQNFLGHTFIQTFNDNLLMIQNATEQLAGDNDLISIRCKKVKERPFTKLVEMQMQAQDKYQKKINEIEQEKEIAERKLGELQKTKSESQKFIISPEQKAEIDNFTKKVAEKNKELKQLRKEFKKDIDRLIFRYEMANIFFVPAIVVFCGLAICMFNNVRKNG